nr:unnamed protein product [Callosobruchus chinensis]
MITVHWTIRRIPESLHCIVKTFFRKCHITFRSLTYNHFLDQSYAADVCMEPMFWFVDNFTYAIGPVIIIGHWLLLNIAFHYYMAVATHPGLPPEGELITEAVSICKKCIAPKPPRTHHCSVCNRCILKMDHHCPWLNNCVGFKNHRYFFLYMVYTVLGVLFVIICGFDVAYTAILLTPADLDEPELEGHSVKINRTGALIPVTDAPDLDESLMDDEPVMEYITPWRRRAIIYMALINTGVLVALGVLCLWHSNLIGRGETSIEANINKAETLRLAELGLVQGRSFLMNVILPSAHKPIGDGLTWHTIHDEDVDEWP